VVPAAACVKNLSPGFFGTVALGQFSFFKTTAIVYFETKFYIFFIYLAYWVKLSSKCDLDSAGCIAYYHINAVLKQTSYFEHCLGGPSINTRVADECACLRRALATPSWTRWTSALLSLQTRLLYGPTSRCGSSQGHLRPCVSTFL
jgi:hypothetical protein